MTLFIKMTWVNLIFIGGMWKSILKLLRNEHFKVLLCNKALITIDLKWLKSTQNLTGSLLLGEKLPVATNIGKERILTCEWLCRLAYHAVDQSGWVMPASWQTKLGHNIFGVAHPHPIKINNTNNYTYSQICRSNEQRTWANNMELAYLDANQ